MGRWAREQKEAWRKQIFEVQAWRQVRGPGGVVMRKTRDLGIKVATVAHSDDKDRWTRE